MKFFIFLRARSKIRFLPKKSQEGVLIKKNFFAWNESRRWEKGFPPFSKKKVLRLHENHSRRVLEKKKIFFSWNIFRRWENEFPPFLKKKKFLRLAHVQKNIFFAWNESRRWENGFPTIFEKKKIFKLVHRKWIPIIFKKRIVKSFHMKTSHRGVLHIFKKKIFLDWNIKNLLRWTILRQLLFSWFGWWQSHHPKQHHSFSTKKESNLLVNWN